MTALVNVLIWLHIVGFAMGAAGGMGMGQVGRRLASAGPDDRATWWPLAKAFAGISGAGLALLLVTGPVVIWLKYQGPDGLNAWFWAKMALVAALVVCFGLDKMGMGRLKRGDEGGAKLMGLAGPLTGLAAFSAAFAAVFAFG